MNKKVADSVLRQLSVLISKAVSALALHVFKRFKYFGISLSDNFIKLHKLPYGSVLFIKVSLLCGESIELGFGHAVISALDPYGLVISYKLLRLFIEVVFFHLRLGKAEVILTGGAKLKRIVNVLIIVPCHIYAPVEQINEQHSDKCRCHSHNRVAYFIYLYKYHAYRSDSCTEAYGDKYAKIDDRYYSLKYNIEP